MTDDDSVFPEPDEAFLERYRRICEQAGVEPVSGDSVRKLVADWNAMMAGKAAPTRTRH